MVAGAGLRWGEAIGLREDAFDLDGARLSEIQTVIEVAGHIVQALPEFARRASDGAAARLAVLPASVD
jgi:hypothetical protein